MSRARGQGLQRRAWIGLVVALGLGGACEKPAFHLIVADTVPIDGGPGEDAGRVGCAAFADLGCVNFLSFDVRLVSSGEILSHCLRVDRRLDDLCELAALADGREVLSLPLGAEVAITVSGRRVYPVDTCQPVGECPAREIFRASTPEVTLAEGEPTEIPLTFDRVGACGRPEGFFGRPSGWTCEQVCGAGNVVCDGVAGGCLCLIAGQ